MNSILPSKEQQQLKNCVELLKTILGSDLLAVYLYGSSLLGGLQKYSDIDLLAITKRKTTLEEKAKFILAFLQISGTSPKRPLELTLVEKTMIFPWQYPPYFDFQYGEWLREPFENGIIEPWENYEMPDLALIVTQVLLKNKTLWGTKADHLLPCVPYKDFVKAMIHDLKRLSADLEKDTRNVLLTFARIWCTLKTDMIRPKHMAADWVIDQLPEKYKPAMKRAKLISLGLANESLGLANESWNDIELLLKPCADYMVRKIYEQNSLIHSDTQKKIKLCEQEN